MTRDLGRVGGSRAGWPAKRWAGVWAAALTLAVATSAGAFQQPIRPVTTTTVPTTAAPAATPKTYAECLRSYAGRTNATAVCQRLFPNAAPSTTAPAAGTTSTTPQAPATTTTPTGTTPPRDPVDITPQVNKLLDAWRNRPRTQPETPKPPADPLAVIPDIQAACAAYASVPDRWRRCVADAWRTAGLRGEPPLVLRNPPVVEPSPVQPPVQPPVVQPPPVQPPVVETPIVQSKPPIQTPPPLTPEVVRPETVRPAPVVAPEPPPAAVVPPSPPVVAPPPKPTSKSPATPIWFWLLALLAAGGAGFGAAKLLNRARKPPRPNVAAAPCPVIALVADPGVVVLTPDGPPRAGMAVSLRFERAADGGEVRLDYPTLETAP